MNGGRDAFVRGREGAVERMSHVCYTMSHKWGMHFKIKRRRVGRRKWTRHIVGCTTYDMSHVILHKKLVRRKRVGDRRGAEFLGSVQYI